MPPPSVCLSPAVAPLGLVLFIRNVSDSGMEHPVWRYPGWRYLDIPPKNNRQSGGMSC
jgi:hypothetical protein